MSKPLLCRAKLSATALKSNKVILKLLDAQVVRVVKRIFVFLREMTEGAGMGNNRMEHT